MRGNFLALLLLPFPRASVVLLAFRFYAACWVMHPDLYRGLIHLCKELSSLEQGIEHGGARLDSKRQGLSGRLLRRRSRLSRRHENSLAIAENLLRNALPNVELFPHSYAKVASLHTLLKAFENLYWVLHQRLPRRPGEQIGHLGDGNFLFRRGGEAIGFGEFGQELGRQVGCSGLWEHVRRSGRGVEVEVEGEKRFTPSSV